ncbi:MAG: amino acid permease [Gemmatimonadetes bacterium]|nr:amino acid permease [Gemmatimonadota bacterium]NNF14606.1 amino acid permease [Gemmatimonadota bacterium]
MPADPGPSRLRKELGLVDVYAISTGAMFSSGFFLLPGLAAAQTGPSVSLAYLVAAIFILPAMFAVAELATAMPRAGGAYYFLDRSMGPLVGTVGGLGTWMALVFKSAFALVGMGAYLALYVDVPIKPLAVGLTVAFAFLNVVGAKETSGLQRMLVGALLVVLAFFLAQGVSEVASMQSTGAMEGRFDDFFSFGLTGFFSTVGFVFVSYAGLTKVASVSEEIRDPDRNIPLGMILSLGTATVVYTVGVFIMVAVLPPEELRADLTPVATSAAAFFDWLPSGTGVVLIVVAAIAAFASTGNAGILSASRYPLAMARDRIVSQRFEELGRFHTPTLGIASTAVFMTAAILLLDIEGIAKLASAFQLLLFSLLSLAVVIMRESEIEGYDPGYRSPLYPFMQVFGFLAPLWLIAEMGQLAIFFTFGLVGLTIGWYFYYARSRVRRAGAILHTFARLGAQRHLGLDEELREIVKEKGLRDEDPYDALMARAPVIESFDHGDPDGLAAEVATRLSRLTSLPVDRVSAGIDRARKEGLVPMAGGVALLHWREQGLERPAAILVRFGDDPASSAFESPEDAHGIIVLVSPDDDPGLHLRLLGHLATRAGEPDFGERWQSARDNDALRATLMREERTLRLRVGSDDEAVPWAGRAVRELDFPPDTLVALVQRPEGPIVPNGETVLANGDRLTMIGTAEGIEAMVARLS